MSGTPEHRIFEERIDEEVNNAFCIIRVELDERGEPADWTFLYVNETLARLEGREPEELVGHRFFELFPERDRSRLALHYRAAWQNRNVSFDDVSEETGRYVHIDVCPIGQPGLCACMLRNISRDILEKRRVQEEKDALLHAYEEERRVNGLIRHYAGALGIVFPLVISLDYLADSYEMVEYDNFLNKTASRSGTIDELIRVGASTVPDAQLARRFWELFNREAAMEAFRSGKREISLRHPQNGDDGRVHYLNTQLICTDCTPECFRAIAMSSCIDEEMERDRAIVRAAEQTRVVRALSDMYSTIVRGELGVMSYRVLKSPKSLKELLGNREEGSFREILVPMVERIIREDAREAMLDFMNPDKVAERVQKADTLSTEYPTVWGEWFEGRFVVQERDETGAALSVLFLARNITEEKERDLRQREELRAAAVEADKANISKTNFLRRMSHDIRTPLNGIVGMLHIMDNNEGNREKYRECMDKILQSADYLLTIVNNVLDISRMESGEIELEYRPFDLERLLLNTMPIIATNAAQNGVIFRSSPEDIHIRHRCCIGSPVHLNRILMNIASNAIKYNREGGSLSVSCRELVCDGEQAKYEFVCEDTGLGMSEEFQKHAFEPFTREGKPTTTSFSGSGLGLSIVREIVGKMGGTVELHSRENVGTTVRITVAMTLDRNYEKTIREEQSDGKLPDLAGHRALLVEDNEINMEIATVLLEEMGLSVTKAENGRRAVDIFAKSEPYTFDLIFMDMMMPEMDGLEATRAIRALPVPDAASVPIIAMTANAFAEDRKACLEAGMNDHVGKPIDPGEIARAIHSCLKR